MEGQRRRGCAWHRRHRRRRGARRRAAAARRATRRRARRHRRARFRRCGARVRPFPPPWRGRGRPATHGGDTLRAASATASAAHPATPSPASGHLPVAVAAVAPAPGGRSPAPSPARLSQPTRRHHGQTRRRRQRASATRPTLPPATAARVADGGRIAATHPDRRRSQRRPRPAVVRVCEPTARATPVVTPPRGTEARAGHNHTAGAACTASLTTPRRCLPMHRRRSMPGAPRLSPSGRVRTARDAHRRPFAREQTNKCD